MIYVSDVWCKYQHNNIIYYSKYNYIYSRDYELLEDFPVDKLGVLAPLGQSPQSLPHQLTTVSESWYLWIDKYDLIVWLDLL